MGWQDAPVVGGTKPKAATPAWQSAPVVTQPAGRNSAPPVPVATKQQDVQAVARRNLEKIRRGSALNGIIPEPIRNFSEALNAGVQNFFGLGPRLDALLRGGGEQNLAIARAENQQSQARNPAAAFMGNVAASAGGGNAIAAGLRAGGARLAASKAPAIARGTGNVLSGLATLKKGQAIRNAGKIVMAGAAGGGAQAAGEGKNVGEGAAIGAASAGVLIGGGKLAKAGIKGTRNILGFEPVDQILAKYVKTPVAEIRQEMQRRAAQGLPSTVYEVLPAGDRQALDDAIGKMPDRQRARITDMVRGRAQNIVQETADRAGAIARPTGPEPLRASLARDLAQSRNPNDLPTPDDIAMAERAAIDPTDMDELKTTEARNIMAPHDPVRAANSVQDLAPTIPREIRPGEIEQVADPEVASTLRTAAGRLALRDPEQGITIGEVTQILSRLSKMGTSSNRVEAAQARNAAEHVMDFLETNHPELNREITRMRAQWRLRTETYDAMLEGNQSRTRSAAGFAGVNPRGVRQLYDAPEGATPLNPGAGATGRNFGQGARLQADILTSPTQSIGALNEIATNPTKQAAISANLGNDAGQNLAEVAQMQTQSARNLSPLLRDQAAEAGHDPVHILQNLMMLSPNTLPATKALALSRLVKGSTRIPEKQANALVDMLFSQNPTQISRALGALGKMGAAGTEFRNSLGATIGAVMAQATPPEGQNLVGVGTNEDGSAYPQYGNVSDDPAEDQGQDPTDEMLNGIINGPTEEASPYAPRLDEIYQSESPEFLSLIERQFNQESGNQHFDRSGRPKTSSAGAIGIAQVMPGTAPIAAQLAGLPYDPDAYQNDPAYNKAIGMAYMKAQLLHFDGDVAKALAAYNAGPGRVEQAVSRGGQAWLNHVPAETQNYVLSILGG